MDLSQVRLIWVNPHPRAVLYLFARVRIAFHAKPGAQPDFKLRRFAETMRGAEANGNDCSGEGWHSGPLHAALNGSCIL
jgi:hypothetical protein